MRHLRTTILLMLLTTQLWAAVIPDGKAVPREAGAPELPTTSQSSASRTPAPPPETTPGGKRPSPKSSDPSVVGDPSKAGNIDHKNGRPGQSQSSGPADDPARRSDLPLANQRSLSMGTYLLIALVGLFVIGAGMLKGRNDRED